MLCYALKGRYWDGKKERDDKDNERKKERRNEKLPVERKRGFQARCRVKLFCNGNLLQNHEIEQGRVK